MFLSLGVCGSPPNRFYLTNTHHHHSFHPPTSLPMLSSSSTQSPTPSFHPKVFASTTHPPGTRLINSPFGSIHQATLLHNTATFIHILPHPSYSLHSFTLPFPPVQLEQPLAPHTCSITRLFKHSAYSTIHQPGSLHVDHGGHSSLQPHGLRQLPR